MNFIPEQQKVDPQNVPYFEDTRAEDGWQGHTTNKSIETLKGEIISALSRLNGLVTGFQRGTFLIGNRRREGFQIHYVIGQSDGIVRQGRLDIAALPVKDNQSLHRSFESRKEKSLKMALYMLRNALDGTWFLQQLSPGYAPLMPWVIAKEGKTVTQLWSESAFNNLLPSGKVDFVDAEIINDK